MLIALCLSVLAVAHTTADADVSYPLLRQYPLFSSASSYGNLTYVTDFEASPNVELVNQLVEAGDVNQYLLYTRKNPTSPQYLTTGNVESLRASNFHAAFPIVVLIHGWDSKPFQEFDESIRDALLQKRDVNVIVVGWQKLSCLDYASAVSAVPSVGRNVGRFLLFLNSAAGATLLSMHIVGHSLGAHVAGNAGRETGSRVARVTGLDPAGPLWNLNPDRISPEDAIYVEAIHTNGLGLGIGSEVGKADFFPNGGTSQPGCSSIRCNHSRSYKLFAASITYNHLVGTNCSSHLQMTLNNCSGGSFPLGNDDLTKRGSGIYRLSTWTRYPY